MNLSQIKATVKVGDVFDVTNHYITREDHPCYGTRRVTVTKVTSSSFHFTVTEGDRGGDSRIEWPKAAQVSGDADTIDLRGGGVAQGPLDPFLTLRRVIEPAVSEDREAPAYTISRANLDARAGRVLTDDELHRIEKALDYSTLGETIDAVVDAVAGLASDEDDADEDEPSDEFTEGYSVGYYGTEPPLYLDAADVAEYERGLAAGRSRAEREDHPEHTGCVDGCGLDVTHDGACLDKPGGRELCAHFACPACDRSVILLALPGSTSTRTGWFHEDDETPMHGIEPWVGSPPVGALEAARRL